jgi:putative IMPACT (imprinted ancient) family translation regulator
MAHTTNAKLKYSDKKPRKLNHLEASWAVAKELNNRTKTFLDMMEEGQNSIDFLNQNQLSQRDKQMDKGIINCLVKKILKFIVNKY